MPLEPSEAQCLYCGEPAKGAAKRGAPEPEAGGEEAESNPVSIATFDTVEEAEACKAKLEAAGVSSMVDAGASGAEWGQFASSGPRSVQLWVRETDAEQAMNILQGDFAGNGHPEGNHAVAEPEAAEMVEEEEPVRAEESGRFHADAPAEAYEAESIQSRAPTGDDLRSLEAKLSALMDEQDVPGWEVNPAYHAEVEAFIEEHSNNSTFVKKARALQENRASYYEAMKGRETSDVAEAEAIADADEAEADESTGHFADGEDVPDVGTLRSGRGAKLKGMPRKRSKVSALLIVLLLVPAVVAGGYIGYTQFFQGDGTPPPGPVPSPPGPGPGPVAVSGDQALTAAVTAADAKGPWKWADLPAQRAAVPADGNAATRVLGFAADFEKAKIKAPQPAAPFLAKEPWVLFGIKEGSTLRAALAKLPRTYSVKALAFSRPNSKGRFPDRSVEEALTPPPYLETAVAARDVVLLEAARQAQLKQADNALIFIQIALGIGRCVGDDPSLEAQQFRVETRHLVVESLERVLRWGTPAKEALATTQALLQDEVSQPLLTYAARGQRALMHEALTKIEGANGTAEPALVGFLAGADGASIPAEQWKDAEWLKANHAVILEQYAVLTELESAKEANRAEQLQQVEAKLAELAKDRNLARLAIAPMAAFARAYLASQAELATAITALAAERYRLEGGGSYPIAVGQLVPKVVSKNPIDPLDGKEMKIIPFDKKGALVYSVGPDGKDDGGATDRTSPGKAGTDVVFRLWAPAQRGPLK